MIEDISIIEDYDKGLITLKFDMINVVIPVEDFALITLANIMENGSMLEMCLCYQEQFGEDV